uniref:Ribosomal protein S10 n=1 Tax=Petalonia binghamiae TaxID=698476 RepID=A0A2H4ZR19_9PHAE|nr:ribosomal protein S10 [Endarachne binghamiae]AUG32984.1 ribosomal protein S10 [Endarachne binghamiae]AZJ13593.1 ribosomal protein S10 [Endarachne binghamiae]
MNHTVKTHTYLCKVWSSSTDLKALKNWFLLLPLIKKCTGLSTKTKRFTLLRSPLGNKTAKDQFERKEYRSYFFLKSEDPSRILAFLNILRHSTGVKLKILIKLQ